MMFTLAATGPFLSLNNTDFVVLLGFIIFLAILLFAGVPGMLSKQLDARAEKIRGELDEARRLRDEAQSVLADFEKRKKEVSTQAASIVAQAKAEAERARDQAEADLEASVERRLKAATDQIASAEQDAVKAVRDRAVEVAVQAAGEVLSSGVDAGQGDALIDAAIKDVQAKLH